MSERFAFYRCETCGNLVQVFISGEGELVCCGKPMTLLQPHKMMNLRMKNMFQFFRRF